MKSPRYTILIASRKSGAVRRLTFSRRLALSAAAFVAALPVLMGLGLHGASVSEVDALREANESLRLENESFRDATGELTAQIASLQTALTQLGEQGTLDANTRAALAIISKSKAAGGSGVVTLPPSRPAAQAPETTFGVLRSLLGAIENRLTSVKSEFETRDAQVRAAPSAWPVSGWLSSLYGDRKDPFTGLPDFHPAIDIAAERGKPVKATGDAVVESVGYLGNYGNQVLLDHGFGIATRYGHLAAFNVRVGQKVKRNEVIGYVGATGRATSPHLHYEIIVNGRTMNPLRILSGR